MVHKPTDTTTTPVTPHAHPHEDRHAHAKPTIPVSAGEPGYGLGIAGFVTSFFVSVVGLVLSAIALKQSKRINRKNSLAFAGFIIGLVLTIIHVLGLIAAGIFITIYVVTCSKDPGAAICDTTSSNSYYHDGTLYQGPTDNTNRI